LKRLCRLLREIKKAILPLEGPEGREDRHEGLAEPDPREVGLQVPCCDRSIISAADVLRKAEEGERQYSSGSVSTEGDQFGEGNVQPDHIHMLLSIPSKFSLAMTLGYLKGSSGK
jgi:hypothetical protein